MMVFDNVNKPRSSCKRSITTGLWIACLSLPASPAWSVEALTEDDMSNISLESQSLEQLLSIDGSSAAGEGYVAVTETRDLSGTVSKANSDTDRLYKDNTKVDGQQPNLKPNTLSAEDLISAVTSEANGEMGNALSIIDPKLRINESSVNSKGGLVLDNSASIKRIQVVNARDDTNAIRGSYYYSNINATVNTTINGR